MSTIEINDVLALAAVDRAVRHQPAGTQSGVPIWAAYEHLGISQRSGAARRLRAQLAALDGSALERGKRHGAETWRLTPAGKRRLSRLRRKDELPGLPESPQHRAWREAHALAGERIEEFRVALLEEVERAQGLLDAPVVAGAPSSDVVFELGERLHRACRRLGSAAYCLYEWSEPDDAHADLDNRADPGDTAFVPRERTMRHARRAGRRNTRLWDLMAQRVYLGQAIQAERQLQGMSTAELARKTGAGAGAGKRRIERLEAGQVDPDYQLLLALARALNLKAGELVGRARQAEETAA